MKIADLSASFYTSKFMVTLLNQFDDAIKRRLFLRQLLPYTVLVILTITYMHHELKPRDSEKIDWSAEWVAYKVIGSCIVLLTLDTLFMEYKQLASSKLDYFCDFFNMIDLSGLIVTLLVTILTLFEIDWIAVESLRVMAAVTSCMLIFKFYDWLRLTRLFSFSIHLIGATIKDIRWFIALFVLALLAFGVPLMILDYNSTGDQVLVNSTFGFWVFDALFNQYLLSLGTFDLVENIGDNS